jgi:hypothetical protein
MQKWRGGLRSFFEGGLEDSECRKKLNNRSAARHASNADRRNQRNTDVQVWLNADQQLNEGMTRIELKWKVNNQPRWPSNDDDEGLLKVVVRAKSPKARCESLKGTDFGVGAPSFGASAANFGWIPALLYKSSSTSNLNSPTKYKPFILPASFSCTATKAAMVGDVSSCHKTVVDYSAHHYQIFSHCKISGSLMSCTGAAFGDIARDVPISK